MQVRIGRETGKLADYVLRLTADATTKLHQI
jgi:hypothetical protein